jgi:hypothetical protein
MTRMLERTNRPQYRRRLPPAIARLLSGIKTLWMAGAVALGGIALAAAPAHAANFAPNGTGQLGAGYPQNCGEPLSIEGIGFLPGTPVTLEVYGGKYQNTMIYAATVPVDYFAGTGYIYATAQLPATYLPGKVSIFGWQQPPGWSYNQDVQAEAVITNFPVC